MVRLVITEQFSDWIESVYDSGDKIFRDFIYFLETLTEHVEIYSDFSSSSIISDKSPVLFRCICNYNSPKIVCHDDLELIFNDCFNGSVNYITLFFIGESQFGSFLEKRTFGCDVFRPGDFKEKWKYFMTHESRDGLTQFISSGGFNNWGKIGEFQHSINTIIVQDPYVLRDMEKLKQNLIGLLKELLSFGPDGMHKEIVIITSQPARQENNSRSRALFSTSYYESVIEHLKDELKISKLVDIYIFVTTQSMPFHARLVLSNYWNITFGTSIDFFDNHGRVLSRTSDKIDFKMNFKKSLGKSLRDQMELIKSYILYTKDDPSIGLLPPFKRRYGTSSVESQYLPKLVDDYLAVKV